MRMVAGSADPHEAAFVREVTRRTGARPQVATGAAELLLLLDPVVAVFVVEAPGSTATIADLALVGGDVSAGEANDVELYPSSCRT